ncbi:collagenase-like isoform X4 [Leguminivora glycinivorella]|uniref:collagenase-like isoform X4 n=1 Tax=Leguminivora glycinivorella TaxID=1035111 RepID=UPI00200DAFD4|nr:collagenase-like isoform X4 [Leguminivora glycinivorella]
MKSWGVIVFLVALAGVQVFADDAAFIENARSPARIVSGWEAEEGQIPWQLSLRMVNPTGDVFTCGGSIIHPEWGLTAAHCTANRVTMVLRAGAVSLLRPELIFETFEYFNHPLYIDAIAASKVQPHDIAILKFQRTITFSDRVQPIRVQNSLEKDRNYNGVRLEASGWGSTWTDGAAPENLQWVYLSGDSNEFCRSAYNGSSVIVNSTICASAYNVTSQSTCHGDSGGPLVELEEDGKYTLVGVTSFVSGRGCHVGIPAGFIRPGYYHDWILEVTGINFDWVPEPPSESSSSESKSSESSEEKSESRESSESESKDSSESKSSSESESKNSSESESKDSSESKSKESSESESKDSSESKSESNETKESSDSKDTNESQSKETNEIDSKETSEASKETVEVESKETSEAQETEEAKSDEEAVEESKETAEAVSEETNEETSEEVQSRLFWSVFRGASPLGTF